MLKIQGSLSRIVLAQDEPSLLGLKASAKKAGSDFNFELSGHYLYGRSIFLGYDFPNGNGDAIPSFFAGTFATSFIGKKVDYEHLEDDDNNIGAIMATWHIDAPMPAIVGPRIIGKNCFGYDTPGRNIFRMTASLNHIPRQLLVEGIFRIDRRRSMGDIVAKRLIAKDLQAVSQEAATGYALCPVCAHKIQFHYDKPCEHLIRGSLMAKTYQVEGYTDQILAHKMHQDPVGDGLGIVKVPAFDTAQISEITASLKSGQMTLEAAMHLIRTYEEMLGPEADRNRINAAAHDFELASRDAEPVGDLAINLPPARKSGSQESPLAPDSVALVNTPKQPDLTMQAAAEHMPVSKEDHDAGLACTKCNHHFEENEEAHHVEAQGTPSGYTSYCDPCWSNQMTVADKAKLVQAAYLEETDEDVEVISGPQAAQSYEAEQPEAYKAFTEDQANMGHGAQKPESSVYLCKDSTHGPETMMLIPVEDLLIEAKAGKFEAKLKPVTAAGKRWYVGEHPKEGKREAFESDVAPTQESHGQKYPAVTGPFRTRRGADWHVANPGHQQNHVLDIEEAAKVKTAANLFAAIEATAPVKVMKAGIATIDAQPLAEQIHAAAVIEGRLNCETASLARHAVLAASMIADIPTLRMQATDARIKKLVAAQTKLNTAKAAMAEAIGLKLGAGDSNGTVPAWCLSATLNPLRAFKVGSPAFESARVEAARAVPSIQGFHGRLNCLTPDKPDLDRQKLVAALVTAFDAFLHISDPRLVRAGKTPHQMEPKTQAFMAALDALAAWETKNFKKPLEVLAATAELTKGTYGFQARRLRLPEGVRVSVMGTTNARKSIQAFAGAMTDYLGGAERRAKDILAATNFVHAGQPLTQEVVLATKMDAAMLLARQAFDFKGSLRPEVLAAVKSWQEETVRVLGAAKREAGDRQVQAAWNRIWDIQPFASPQAFAADIAKATGVPHEVALLAGKRLKASFGGMWPSGNQPMESWPKFLADKQDADLEALVKDWQGRIAATVGSEARTQIEANIARVQSTLDLRRQAQGVRATFMGAPTIADAYWLFRAADGKVLGRLSVTRILGAEATALQIKQAGSKAFGAKLEADAKVLGAQRVCAYWDFQSAGGYGQNDAPLQDLNMDPKFSKCPDCGGDIVEFDGTAEPCEACGAPECPECDVKIEKGQEYCPPCLAKINASWRKQVSATGTGAVTVPRALLAAEGRNWEVEFGGNRYPADFAPAEPSLGVHGNAWFFEKGVVFDGGDVMTAGNVSAGTAVVLLNGLVVKADAVQTLHEAVAEVNKSKVELGKGAAAVSQGAPGPAKEFIRDGKRHADDAGKLSEIAQGEVQASPGFDKWLDTFVSEKGIDLEDAFEVEGPSGTNHIPYGVVIEHMKIASPQEQAALKNMLVKLDFKNAAIEPYLKHLGQAIAANKVRASDVDLIKYTGLTYPDGRKEIGNRVSVSNQEDFDRLFEQGYVADPEQGLEDYEIQEMLRASFKVRAGKVSVRDAAESVEEALGNILWPLQDVVIPRNPEFKPIKEEAVGIWNEAAKALADGSDEKLAETCRQFMGFNKKLLGPLLDLPTDMKMFRHNKALSNAFDKCQTALAIASSVAAEPDVRAGLMDDSPEGHELFEKYGDILDALREKHGLAELHRGVYNAHKDELYAEIKKAMGTKKYGQDVHDALEDENAAFLIEALKDQGLFESGVKASMVTAGRLEENASTWTWAQLPANFKRWLKDEAGTDQGWWESAKTEARKKLIKRRMRSVDASLVGADSDLAAVVSSLDDYQLVNWIIAVEGDEDGAVDGADNYEMLDAGKEANTERIMEKTSLYQDNMDKIPAKSVQAGSKMTAEEARKALDGFNIGSQVNIANVSEEYYQLLDEGKDDDAHEVADRARDFVLKQLMDGELQPKKIGAPSEVTASDQGPVIPRATVQQWIKDGLTDAEIGKRAMEWEFTDAGGKVLPMTDVTKKALADSTVKAAGRERPQIAKNGLPWESRQLTIKRPMAADEHAHGMGSDSIRHQHGPYQKGHVHENTTGAQGFGPEVQMTEPAHREGEGVQEQGYVGEGRGRKWVSSKVMAGITQLPSGRWKDTNGNSYATRKEAMGAERANQGEPAEEPKAGPEYPKQLPSGRWKDENGNSYATRGEAARAQKDNFGASLKADYPEQSLNEIAFEQGKIERARRHRDDPKSPAYKDAGSAYSAIYPNACLGTEHKKHFERGFGMEAALTPARPKSHRTASSPDGINDMKVPDPLLMTDTKGVGTITFDTSTGQTDIRAGKGKGKK